MNPDHVVLMELQVSGCQYAAQLEGEWKSSDPYTVRKHRLPPHFNLEAIGLHRQGTKVGAQCRMPSLDLDVHADEFDTRTMQAGVNEEIQYALRAEGFEGVVDQSSPNGGLHIRLKASITKPALQDWFHSKGLPFPEYFGQETNNRLGLPAFDGGPAWSLQDPAMKVRGLDAYIEIWTSLPEVSPNRAGAPNPPEGRRIQNSVPPVALPAPDPMIQQRLRWACGYSLLPLGRRFRAQPAIVDDAVFKAGLAGFHRDVLIANLVAHMIGRGRTEKPWKITRQITALVDGALARREANRKWAATHSVAISDPVEKIIAAVLSKHGIGEIVPIAGSYIREITGINHRRRHAEVKRGLVSSGYLKQVTRGSNLNGRCDLYMVIAE